MCELRNVPIAVDRDSARGEHEKKADFRRVRGVSTTNSGADDPTTPEHGAQVYDEQGSCATLAH